jgi:hypothetical protein
MKTRSSSGVGQKIDLQFDTDTLRITDEGENEYDNKSQPSPNNILNQIKTSSTVSAGPIMNSNLEELEEVAAPKSVVVTKGIHNTMNNLRPNF